ncbi:MAG: hypothetical protein Fur0012_11820 [Elusimicrobiota bacterium]
MESKEDSEERFPALFLTGHYTEAFKLALRLLESPPSKKFLTYLREPWLYPMVRDKNYMKALEEMSRIYESLRRLKAGKEFSAWKNYYQQVLSFYIPGEEEKEVFTKIKKVPRKLYWALHYKGKKMLFEGRFHEAVKNFMKVLKNCPYDWETRCLMAEALILSGQKKEGFSHFDRALEGTKEKNEKLQITAWKSEFLMLMGLSEKALNLLNNCQKTDFLNCWKGAALVMSGKFSLGANILKNHINKNPLDYEARIWLAEALARQGKFKKALSEISLLKQRLLKENAERYLWAALAIQSFIFEKQGENKKAEKIFSQIDHQVLKLFFTKQKKASAEKLLSLAKGSRRGELYLLKGLFFL